MTREVVLIVARAANGVIGNEGGLPWHIPDDLRRFKALTMGAPMVMGRRTFDSLPGLLPGRRHIVMTRDPAWQAAGTEPAGSLDEALTLAGDGRIWIIGGAEIFRQAMPIADRIELTEIQADMEGDTILPAFTGWRETAREDRDGHSFVTLLPPLV